MMISRFLCLSFLPISDSDSLCNQHPVGFGSHASVSPNPVGRKTYMVEVEEDDGSPMYWWFRC